MPFILSPDPAKRPRVLIINPNATEAFTEAMHGAVRCPYVELDFYSAPAACAPASIEGAADSAMSAAACLHELRGHVDKWDGFVVACFSAHPLAAALRELSPAPVVGILEAPLLFASTLGSRVGILTSSPRWVPLLARDISALSLAKLNAAGVISSGFSVLELESRPREQVLARLCAAAEELQDERGADVIILGCAAMVGLEGAVRRACRPGMVVLDPVKCALEMVVSLVRMGAGTSKIGIYAQP